MFQGLWISFRKYSWKKVCHFMSKTKRYNLIQYKIKEFLCSNKFLAVHFFYEPYIPVPAIAMKLKISCFTQVFAILFHRNLKLCVFELANYATKNSIFHDISQLHFLRNSIRIQRIVWEFSLEEILLSLKILNMILYTLIIR